MEDKVGLTLACLNLKKLVKMMAGKPFYFGQLQGHVCHLRTYFLENFKKRQTSKKKFVFSLVNTCFLNYVNSETTQNGILKNALA